MRLSRIVIRSDLLSRHKFWFIATSYLFDHLPYLRCKNSYPLKPIMKLKYLLLSISLLGLASSQAAVILYAEYHLGEAGSLGTNKLPQDSSGNARHFVAEIGGTTALTQTTGVSAPGSTVYLDTSMAGNQGFFFGDNSQFTALGTDNFAFGVYARGGTGASATTAAGDVFQLGANVNNTYKLSLESTGWRASSANISYIGSTATFSTDTWVHLALIRNNGQTGFFVNGVQQGGNFATAPVIGAPYLSQAPGNAANANFDGHLDEARIVTFTSGESTVNIMNALTNIPEPSSALLCGLGILTLLRRRRN